MSNTSELKVGCALRSWPEYVAVGRSSNQFHIINLIVEEEIFRSWSLKEPKLEALVDELTRSKTEAAEIMLKHVYSSLS